MMVNNKITKLGLWRANWDNKISFFEKKGKGRDKTNVKTDFINTRTLNFGQENRKK
jgi:hypothetical protein